VDPHEILGVSLAATEEEIRGAFRKLALEWHPDRNASPEAPSKFNEISWAYAVLVNPDQREIAGLDDILTVLFRRAYGGPPKEV